VSTLDKLNDQLYRVYSTAWDNLVQRLPDDRQLSDPHFIKVPQEYIDANLKLLIIGQQTNGWTQEGYKPRESARPDVVDRIMHEYDVFKCGINYRPTPFFQGAHGLARLLEPTKVPCWFVWSNLIKIDGNGAADDSWVGVYPGQHIEEILGELPLVQSEVEILSPDAVVFLVGPDYIKRLQLTFPDLESINVTTKKPWSVLKSPKLPQRSYVTYHPKYLRMSDRWNVIDEIANHIKSNS